VIELEIIPTGVLKTVYSNRGVVTSSITYTSESNLPDDIRTKLAILKLMQNGDDIPDVGQKINKWLYWIYEGTVSQKLISNLIKGNFMKSHPLVVRHKVNEYNKKIDELTGLSMQIFRNPEATEAEVLEAREYLLRNQPMKVPKR
jgi:hypothetical protein